MGWMKSQRMKRIRQIRWLYDRLMYIQYKIELERTTQIWFGLRLRPVLFLQNRRNWAHLVISIGWQILSFFSVVLTLPSIVWTLKYFNYVPFHLKVLQCWFQIGGKVNSTVLVLSQFPSRNWLLICSLHWKWLNGCVIMQCSDSNHLFTINLSCPSSCNATHWTPSKAPPMGDIIFNSILSIFIAIVD